MRPKLVCIVANFILFFNFISLESPAMENKQLKINLKNHIQVLSSAIGERNFVRYDNLERSRRYINEQFERIGYSATEQTFHLEGRPYHNIIATKEGQDKKDKIIIVGAHYDSVIGSPGADDNASGVAGLLELAKLLYKIELNKTIKFVAFTNEEPPLFMTKDMGSLRYAQQAKRKGEDIQAMLCLESIGYYRQEKSSQSYPLGLGFFYPSEGNFIAVASNFRSAALLKRIVKDFKRASSFPIEYLIVPIFLAPAVSFSDNWSFWKMGYRAVMITDTAFYRNPYYHTPEDTMDKLDYRSSTELIKGLYFVLLELAK